MSRLKLLIIGNKRHGKDTCAEILRDNFHFNFKSSSEAAVEIFIYDLLKEKHGYTSFKECFEDRVNHRELWYNLIVDYNKDDKMRLSKQILKTTNCYVGMRSFEEVEAAKGLFDLIVWVDGGGRLPLEDVKSMTANKQQADIIIENNYSLADFKENVIKLGNCLFEPKMADVWLDIDGVLADFSKHFLKYFEDKDQTPPICWDDPRFRIDERWHIVKKDPYFWLTIPRLVDPSDIPFNIKGYITARSIPDALTQEWLDNKGFPKAPLVSVGMGNSKVKACEDMGVTLFVDDSYSNFRELNTAGIPTFLMNSSHNLKHKHEEHYRINSLNEITNEHIEYTFSQTETRLQTS